MTTRSTRLTALIDELHQANVELKQAARPLQRLADLKADERERIAERLRAGLRRWEDLSERISSILREPPDLLGDVSGAGSSPGCF
jgi:hypothetical protein